MGHAGARAPLIRLPAPSPRGEKGEGRSASSSRLRFVRRTSLRAERGTAGRAATSLLPSGRRCRQADEGADCCTAHRLNLAI
jgi:hypothetical protein